MKVAVVNNCVPFVIGGAEVLANALVRRLIEHGHDAQLFRLPFGWQPPERIVQSMVAASTMEIVNADRVVALKFPAYYVKHPSKIIWLAHQFRQVYDLWGTDLGLTPTEETRAIRDAIHLADRGCFAECRRVFAISPVTAERLARFNGVRAEVLLPPLPNPAGFSCTEYGSYLFLPGRINKAKRQGLMIEAMRYVRSRVRLVVAGSPDQAENEVDLRRLVERHGLEHRVEILSGFLAEEDKVRLLAGALACPFAPYDEDYGYVALEAYQSRKAVVTTTDAGGARLLVEDGETGFVVPPEPRSLAVVFDRLYGDRALARRMGEAGCERMRGLGLSWAAVVEALTG